ncbi:MAG: hypothetical protein CR968_04390 [Flavobacteriia bacterium]|nr:MAG: hypothetical protein CR968_04390 [Flavobacteriia bacterium]
MKKTLTLLMCMYALFAFSQEDEYTYTQYHPNGKLKTYINHKHGAYIEFYDNLQRKVSGRCEGGIVANLDRKFGAWVYFNKQGDLLKVYHYYCDSLQTQLIFDDSCRVKTGEWIEYYSDKNTIRNKGTLKHYKKEGRWEKYYKNGTLRQVINYKNDIRQGEFFEYYRNGQLAYKAYYENGAFMGPVEGYDEHTGELIIQATMLDGKYNGSFRENYETGKVYKLGTFDRGDKTGEWEYFFENGVLKMKGLYLNNYRDGLWKRYDEQGRLSAEIHFKHGERDGKVVLYNADGTIRETKMYKEGEQIE